MQTTVEIFKSLADETRLRLLILLQGGNEYCVCDLMQALDMPQSTVSRHVAYMRNAGLLNDRRGGVWMYYSIRPGLDPFLSTLTDSTFAKLRDTETAGDDRERLLAYRRIKDSLNCS